MERARFTDEQIIAVLKEHEAGAKTADPARKHGISEATIYNWKAKFGGMEVSEARRLKALEEENAKLKKLLAEQMLDAAGRHILGGRNVDATDWIADLLLKQCFGKPGDRSLRPPLHQE